jgi:hypothetical protein
VNMVSDLQFPWRWENLLTNGANIINRLGKGTSMQTDGLRVFFGLHKFNARNKN